MRVMSCDCVSSIITASPTLSTLSFLSHDNLTTGQGIVDTVADSVCQKGVLSLQYFPGITFLVNLGNGLSRYLV